MLSDRMRKKIVDDITERRKKGGFFYREENPYRCQHISHSEKFPYAKRCKYHKVNEHYCKSHSYSVSWVNPVDRTEKSAWFATIEEAEEFRKRNPFWTECSYRLPTNETRS